MQLRPYQQQALEAVREAYREGHRSALVVMPTGTGKTVLFAEISRLAKGPVLVLAHRQELVEQARAKISAWCDDVVAVEMAGRRELTAPASERPKISVASVQTMSRRLAQVPRDAFKIVVIDEAHHSTADSYRQLVEHFDAWILGVTATPDRGDKQPLGEVFACLAYSYDMREAIDDGWLVPVRSFLVQTAVDFSQVRKIAGELQASEVERILTREPHLAEIAQPILRERGDRPAMVFAASVAHAHALARVLCDLSGDRRFAAALDGSHITEHRQQTIRAFERGEIQVLVNCSLFTEGFDVPKISLVAIARPVLSRSFYAQMVGRGTRLSPGKLDLLVLDFVPGNCRHALVCAVDIFARGDEQAREVARQIALEKSAAGEDLSMEQLMELAQQELESRAAQVDYQLLQRDPFAAVGIDVRAMTATPRQGDAPSDSQIAYLKRAGMAPSLIDQLDTRQAEQLAEELRERKAVGLCSPRQARQLAAWGVDGRELYADHAKALLSYVRRNKQRLSAEQIRRDLAQLDPSSLDELAEG